LISITALVCTLNNNNNKQQQQPMMGTHKIIVYASDSPDQSSQQS